MTVLFRLLLALPHVVWLTLWTGAALLAACANGLVALAQGHSAPPLHRFLAAYVRYTAHVTAFTFLVANPFPGFAAVPGYPVDVEIDEAAHQSRRVILFRPILAIPAVVLSAAFGAALVVAGVLGWFASLATGRVPAGLRNLGAVSVRYQAQTSAYCFLVTATYPHASPTFPPPPEPEAV